MSTGRKGLPYGTKILSDEGTYEILEEFAQGGSALIYKAVKNQKEKVTLKEIYPSDENGFFERNALGQVCPQSFEDMGSLETTHSYYTESQREKDLLERLYVQLEKEEEIGRKLRDQSFLVCNLKVLNCPHLEGESGILRGFAEMQDMNFSGKVLSEYYEELSQVYHNCIPVEISLHIIRQIAETMLKIHNSGYLYCDFSKENIFLLNDSMTAVFIDFGSTMEKVGNYVETDRFIPSTWGYRAPEVALKNYSKKESRIICESSDVYALMAFFYEMISGKPLARESEFGPSKHPRDRMIDWMRMKKIGVKNPVAGLVLNYLLLSGLAYEQEKRLKTIYDFLEIIKQLELIQKKSDHLFETLEIACNWKYEERDGMLKSFFAQALPEKKALNETLERLGKELLSDFQLKKVTYIYTWLQVWFKQLEQAEEKAVTPRMKLLLEYSGLAVCNHNGEYHEALLHYQACESMRDQIELSQYLDARLRAAEGQANFFHFKKAYSLVEENMKVLEMRKRCYKEMAEKLGTYTDSITKTAEYGKNASALARFSAFLSGNQIKKSEKYFALAIQEFEFDIQNRIRVYNSLLQMAIEGRRKDLFETYYEICFGKIDIEEKIMLLLERNSLYGQDVYDLYVLLKSIRAFELEKKMQDSFWKALENLVQKNNVAMKRSHPWELIYRHAAILLAEHKQRVDETVEKLFQMSRKVMKEIEDFQKMPFDTVLVLHMITQMKEYQFRIRFAKTQEEENVYQERLAVFLEDIFSYLRRHKCPVIRKNEWENAMMLDEKCRLLERCSTYEYA